MTVRKPRLFAPIALLLLVACSSSETGTAATPRTPLPRTSENTEGSPSPEPSSRALPSSFDPGSVSLELDEFATGLTGPIAVTHAGDRTGRVFVAEQGGRIVSFDERGRNATVYLDLSSLTVPGGEQGLLGLTFHPDFRNNGRLFVNYTDSDGDTVIAEYRAADPSATSADPGSARVLMTVEQPYANHNGGHLAFGPDGYLYIALGDGGGAGDPGENGQGLGTLLGKILRVDVDSGSPYSIPRGNPFRDQEDARPEIWSYGLRNPWRFSFDRATGEMWIGDVGQSALEEIDRAPPGRGGLNFGWNDMEGSNCYDPPAECEQDDTVLPITEYSHDFGCSITGGHVYRGTREKDLLGGYFFGDYCSGTIWAVPADAPTGTRASEMLQTESSISSFGEDESGEVYLTDLAGGSVFRLVAGS
jgi:glucose/arabinose dehydrogenase